MDDLRRRFAVLDTVAVPDVWPDIERRAEGRLAPVVRSQTDRTQAADRPARAPMVAILFVALLIASTVAVVLVGGWMNRVAPALVPSPTTTETPSTTATPTAPALTFDCAAAQRSASVKADRWVSGPAPAHPRNGWIAAWNSDAVPAVVLVNPVTGGTCRLAEFPDYPAVPHVTQPDQGARDWIPLRGSLAWSPDGRALAIIAVREQTETKPEAQALFVWSELGMVGPLLEAEAPRNLQLPTWSPDGSMLAVGESRGSIIGPQDPASIWILTGNGGSPRRIRAGCDACFGGPAYWSPSGDRIAFRTWTNQDNGVSMGIAIGKADDQVAQLLANTEGADALLGWASDTSIWLVPFGYTVPDPAPAVAGRLFEVTLDPGSKRFNHGYLPGGPGVMPRVAISPDGAQGLQVVERSGSSMSDLELFGFPSGPAERLISGMPATGGPVWWSPDGELVGYLVDEQTPQQGIWLIDRDGSGHRKLTTEPLVIPGDPYDFAAVPNAWQPRP